MRYTSGLPLLKLEAGGEISWIPNFTSSLWNVIVPSRSASYLIKPAFEDNKTNLNYFTNKMTINFNMFNAILEHGVLNSVDDNLSITMYENSLGIGNSRLVQTWGRNQWLRLESHLVGNLVWSKSAYLSN